MSLYLAQLRCPNCDETEFFDKATMTRWLHDCGHLRKQPKPDPRLMFELGQLAAAGQSCRSCSQAGLLLEPPPEEQVDWGEARRCDRCRQPIDPLRLEVFPETTHCTTCQKQEESGTSQQEPEFCPRCGDLMQLRSGSRDLTRYEMVCRSCGR